jgi:succinate dehydrogenase / fumarate reductase cytochrome b subunit
MEPAILRPVRYRPTALERLKRIHALCGVIPLATFVILHLGGNATALWGRGRYERHLVWVDGLTFGGILQVVGVLLPLLVHAGIGIRLMLDPSQPARDPAAPRDWGRLLQRGSGLLALVFIAVHLGHYRLPRAMGELTTRDVYDKLSADLSGMGRFAFYLAGTSAVIFHLSQGVVRFLAPAPTETRRRVVLTVGAAGVLLWLVSLEVLGHFYAGGSFLGVSGALGRLTP